MDKSDKQATAAEPVSATKADKAASAKATNTKHTNKQSKKTEKPVSSARFAGYAFAVSSLAIVVSLSVAGAGVWFWQTFEQTAQQQRLAERQQIQQQIDSAQSALTQVQNQLRAEFDTAKQARAALQSRVTTLKDELGRDRYAWAIAEIRYMLRLANTRLQLFADVDSAQQALLAADRQLLALNDPALHSVRKSLSKEISALKSVPRVDVEGVSLQLVALSERIRELVVQPPARLTSTTQTNLPDLPAIPLSDWRAHLDAIWAKLQKVIIIRKTDEPVKPLIAPDKAENLRLNLGLQIEQARLALLQGNTRLYQRNLQQADTWLGEYFNAAEEVTALQKQLQQLAAIELRPALPDISTSLAELQRLSRYEGDAVQSPAKQNQAVSKEKINTQP